MSLVLLQFERLAFCISCLSRAFSFMSSSGTGSVINPFRIHMFGILLLSVLVDSKNTHKVFYLQYLGHI